MPLIGVFKAEHFRPGYLLIKMDIAKRLPSAVAKAMAGQAFDVGPVFAKATP